MKTNTFKVLATATTLAALAAANGVRAEDCVTQYGGYSTPCQPSDVTINKQVKNPVSGVFVENLGVSDAAFGPGSKVSYKLIVTNASNDAYETVTITDTLPPHLSFFAGPGTYDESTKKLTIKEKDVKPGETRTLEFVAQVMDAGKLPATSFFCEVNKAHVQAGDKSDEDTAEMCVQKEITGKSKLPVAGFTDSMVMVPFALSGLGGMMLFFKRK